MILKINKTLNQQLVVIYIGEFFVSSEPIIISTILGSCVSVCLFDPVIKIGGMNHFMLAEDVDLSQERLYSKKTQLGLYAMEMLLNEILKKGGIKKNLQAKIFGGASYMQHNLIGKNNIEFAKNYLQLEGIPIVSEDTGGVEARKIYFYPQTGKVLLRKISQPQFIDKIKHSQMKNFQKETDKLEKRSGFIDLETLE